MIDRDQYNAQVARMIGVGQTNATLPPDSPQRRITTQPEFGGKKVGKKGRGHQRSTSSIVKEALAANEGGDYAGDDAEPQDAFLGDESIPQVASPFYTWDIGKEEILDIVPKAFIEPAITTYERDHVDDILPPPGFITDFINTSRGMEAPTLFMLWGALWTLSSVLCRHAWLDWYPSPLWPNLYVIIVAPPALCKKSTSLTIGRKLIEAVPECLPSNIEQFEKSIPIVTGKATSDGILGMLSPEERMFLVQEDKTMRYVQRGSKVAFNVGELTTLINKQPYNLNLITTLTSLYDCQDSDSELTRARGKEPLKDIYVTFIGATTPSTLKTSMPEEALGGGFLSRVVVVYQDVPTKIYSMPRAIDDYPVPDDLITKLAWITHNCKGAYRLSPEAFAIYDEQYRNWKKKIFANAATEVSGETRYDVILLKIAMLLRVQEYKTGNTISVENIKCAIKILDYTISGSKLATEDIGMNDYTRWANQLRRMIQRKGAVVRSEAQKALGAKGCKVNDFDMIISQLVAEDSITIMLGSERLYQSRRSGAEQYALTPSALKALEKEPLNEQ